MRAPQMVSWLELTYDDVDIWVANEMELFVIYGCDLRMK